MAKQLAGVLFGMEVYIDADLPFGWWHFDYPRVRAQASRLEAVADAARAYVDGIANIERVGFTLNELKQALCDALNELDGKKEKEASDE